MSGWQQCIVTEQSKRILFRPLNAPLITLLVKSTEVGKWSDTGRKYRIGIFGHRPAKMGKKYRGETFGTIGTKFRRKILFWVKIFKFYPSGPKCRGCTQHSTECHLEWCVKFPFTIFYPFCGWKYRIGISSHWTTKTCKKSWRNFWHHRCKVPKKNTLSKSKCSNFTHLVQTVRVAFCTVPPRHFGTLYQWCKSDEYESKSVYDFGTTWGDSQARHETLWHGHHGPLKKRELTTQDTSAWGYTRASEASVSIYILALALSQVLWARVYNQQKGKFRELP